MVKETSLTRAQTAFLSGPVPTRSGAGGKWVSNDNKKELSFDVLNNQIGKAMAGTEKASGEPTIGWIINTAAPELKASQSSKVEVATFIMSFLNFDILIKNGVAFCSKTNDNDISATVLVCEYESARESGWWSKVKDKLRDFVLVVRHIVKGNMPKFFTSRENKAEVARFEKLAGPLTANVKPWHWEFGPAGKHWYVGVVATSPEHQGKGVGSELMRRIVELADAEQMDCYLECSGEKNPRFYETFGYRKVTHKVLHDTVNEPAGKPDDYYLMTRPHLSHK